MSKKKHVIRLSALAGFLIAVIIFYWPEPIVKDVSNGAIHIIIHYTENGDSIVLEDYNEEEILTYLSTCKERRTLFPDHPEYYSVDAMQLIMHIGDGINTQFITLGDVNLISRRGPFKYKVINVDEDLAQLKEMVHYDVYFPEVEAAAETATPRIYYP